MGPFGDKMSVRDALAEADRIRDQLAREDAEALREKVVTTPLQSFGDPYASTLGRLQWQKAVMMEGPSIDDQRIGGGVPSKPEAESQEIVERIKAELQEKGYMTSPSRYDRFLRMCRAYAKRADLKPPKPLTRKEKDWFKKGERYA